MAIVEIPNIPFDAWRRWQYRPHPLLDFDVPLNFGILGLYLLATSDVTLADAAPTERHLQEAVLYIGMSTHVDQRLERPHNAVKTYCERSGDIKCQDLHFSLWYSDWNKGEQNSARAAVASASIALYERALLLAYAEKHGRLPDLNNV